MFFPLTILSPAFHVLHGRQTTDGAGAPHPRRRHDGMGLSAATLRPWSPAVTRPTSKVHMAQWLPLFQPVCSSPKRASTSPCMMRGARWRAKRFQNFGVEKLLAEGLKRGYKQINIKVAPDPTFDIEMARVLRRPPPEVPRCVKRKQFLNGSLLKKPFTRKTERCARLRDRVWG
jgi:hypothetical protein